MTSWKWYLAIVLVLACINSVLAAWQIDGDYAKKFGFPSNLLTFTALLVSLLFLFYGLRLLFT
jgi:succinate dehydrogenase hydrophobic anchor subunit